MNQKTNHFATIPMRDIGPLRLNHPLFDNDVMVPLATFESPLWPSTNRGAKISRLCGGINVTLIQDTMSRSIMLQAPSAQEAKRVVDDLSLNIDSLIAVVTKSSSYAKLTDWTYQIVGNILYLRFQFTTGDASGHNMVTKACGYIITWVLKQYDTLSYLSISSNYCTDKKASAVNGILGRGKYVVAEVTIPRTICQQHLRTTPEKIVELNIKKNLIGTNLAGSVRTANAHFANLLLALYLATGQDAANIIEGSQGFVHCEVVEGGLYFSVTLPNIIVGTVGNGKHHDFVNENLKKITCNSSVVGDNAIKLALVVAGTVLCGELSLMAALSNSGELMQSHELYERQTTLSVEDDR